jgi:serine/threonine protein kinase
LAYFEWLDEADRDHLLRRPVIYLLIKLASTSQQLPPSLYVTGVVIGEGRDPKRWGGFADVYLGQYEGRSVALKKLKISDWGPQRLKVHKVQLLTLVNEVVTDIMQMLCREALVWKQLHHPNVLPFIGIDAGTFRSTECLCMVSDWMERGTVMEFMRSSTYDPMIDRDRLVRANGRSLITAHSFSFLSSMKLPEASSICTHRKWCTVIYEECVTSS